MAGGNSSDRIKAQKLMRLSGNGSRLMDMLIVERDHLVAEGLRAVCRCPMVIGAECHVTYSAGANIRRFERCSLLNAIVTVSSMKHTDA